ncbi:CvfB family protein [Rheinheimera sp. SA_1]|jgi:predicted RNA-binding protein (virulence factor B family)|uniref:CvfB family protein n=1 Tax=Rheinheimera sp. SA_1 TaxID=1827365 RepID=UPI000A89AD24|nr:S1-like domain-containing RNA-binding protein [Rheinheimera sp. SA_1]
MFLGQLNTLVVKKKVEFGVYLDGLHWGDILLPRRYVPLDAEVGSSVSVFLYLDSEDQLIATTEKPLVMVGQVAQLKVVASTKVGAFLNWGLKKDLLVPFSEQHLPMQLDYSYLVYCYVDRSNRIVASSKLDKFIGKTTPSYQPGDEVHIMVTEPTELGYKAVVDHQHWGVLYKDQVFKPLRRGYTTKAFINKVRADGKIDLLLEKPGYQKTLSIADQILQKLNAANGELPLSDKSEPEAIYAAFGVSKKVFKQAIGGLMKDGKISIEPQKIVLKQS